MVRHVEGDDRVGTTGLVSAPAEASTVRRRRRTKTATNKTDNTTTTSGIAAPLPVATAATAVPGRVFILCCCYLDTTGSGELIDAIDNTANVDIQGTTVMMECQAYANLGSVAG